MELRSSSPGETEAIAARLAEGLATGDVVTVSGELGTGKRRNIKQKAVAVQAHARGQPVE